MKCNNTEEIKIRKEKLFCEEDICCRDCDYNDSCGVMCDIYMISIDTFNR